jgi:hypothetical protein
MLTIFPLSVVVVGLLIAVAAVRYTVLLDAAAAELANLKRDGAGRWRASEIAGDTGPA